MPPKRNSRPNHLKELLQNIVPPSCLDITPDPLDIIRFLQKVRLKTDTECWLWTGHVDDKGYGQFKWKGKAYWSHRWSYAVFRRPLIGGLTVEHKCRTPSCVNPYHLELLTNVANVANQSNHRYPKPEPEDETPF
jgi:hypothetical protein